NTPPPTNTPTNTPPPTNTPISAPAAPTGLQTSGITQTAITLSWTKSTGATGYKVQANNGAVTTLGDVSTHTFGSLSAGTSYTLKVIATNAGGDSSAVTISASTLLAAPTGLQTSGITQTAITLSWTKSTGATAYKVQANSGAVTTLGNVATHTFSGLTANTQYTLKVIASNSGGDSAAAPVSARTLATQPAALTSPSSVSTSGITQTAITLSWTKSNGATSYEVQGGTLSNWTDVSDVATYTFSGLSADTEYTVSVRAKNSQTTSAAVTLTRRTLVEVPPPPSGMSSSAITESGVQVSWSPSARATGYETQGTEMSDDVEGQAAPQVLYSDWTDIGNVNSISFTGLEADTEYRIYVRANNSGGASSPSFIDVRTRPPFQGSDIGRGSPDSGRGDGDSAPGDGDRPRSGDSGSSRSGDRADGAPTATATRSEPAFNCTDEQKAMIAISSQPIGLNVQCVGPVGLGAPDLIARGAVLGVDVWGWVRGYFEVCFKQAGDLVFLDAAYAPRLQSDADSYGRNGMICSQVDRAGTLVLLRPSSTAPTAVPTRAASANPTAAPAQFSGCVAITTDPLNFRATPGGRILLTLPALTTVSVYDRRSGWLQVEYNGQRGWISGVYTRQTGNCG
ncbi:MAG: fibronectin type III domain-containing protein, partial [Chloroflexi bacterium]|nr:fibronectin type III domain-containing protein [Chloroflexota bacterium]